MSYNNNFYHNCGTVTFHNQAFSSPPPPQHFLQSWPSEIRDEDFVKQFENKTLTAQPIKWVNSVSISKVHDQIRNLVLALNEIKLNQKLLSEKVNELSDDEWKVHLKQVDENKAVISQILSHLNNLNTDILRKCLAKRASKRTRQKRQRVERRKQKAELKKQNEEKSRKIDEYLQKFQDNIKKAKHEEEAKLQADAVLRETIRKKQDAKKYIVKLDALVKLRQARMNTARGRGEGISEKEAEVFEINIEKLKSMWSQRLIVYEKEESELRATLQQDLDLTNENETEKEVKCNLEQWKGALFGGEMPQVDFSGNVDKFLAVRSRWDKYLNAEGTYIPIGWVPPKPKS